LVTILERAAPDFPRAYAVLRKLLPPDRGFTEVILGCTHYRFFADLAAELYPSAGITDGAGDAVNKLYSVVRECKPEKFPEVRFIFTGADKTDLYERILESLLLNRPTETLPR
jgi:glutamate racemase